MGLHRANIGAFKTRFNGRLSVFKRGVLLSLFKSVIKDTPVLTGRLRGNWKFGKTTIPEPNSETPPDKTGAAATAAMTSGVLGAVTEADDSYYLENSMPYCHKIEYEGWSHTKAPQGMVRKNIVRIAANLAEEAAKSE